MLLLGDDEKLSNLTLGGDYPYWFRQEDGRVATSLAVDDLIESIPAEKREIDPVAVLSMLCFGYICLDRTLIKGLNRLPWLSEVDSVGGISFRLAPNHGTHEMDTAALASLLLDALRKELASICQGRERVWCLLSGGMDSRIAAAVLSDLQRHGEVVCEVHAATWGMDGCRDVIYAQKMAEHLGWQWHHIPIDSDDYWRNFENSARYLGAEVSPCHLHRMDWFSQLPKGDIVVAASYGDSVGRAEFSGKHVSGLLGLQPFERYGLISAGCLKHLLPQLKRDIWEIRNRYGERSETGWREIEQQAHYMRRLIAHALGIINRWGSMRQVFVDQSVFGLMWDQAPHTRTNNIYSQLLAQIDPKLLRIPWARTGIPFTGAPNAKPDSYPKRFHQYGSWLRHDHAEKLEHLLFEKGINELGIFDMGQLRWAFKEWKRLRTENYTGIGDRLSWIATLSLFCRAYHIGPAKLPGSVFQIPLNLTRKAYCRALQARIRLLKPDYS